MPASGSTIPGTRTWGDGADDRRVHVIEDIHYGPTVSSIRCRCGTLMSDATPEALSVLWRRHGGSVLDHKDVRDRTMTAINDEASASAMRAIIALAGACTCDTTPVTECPNYMPGDER